MTNKQMYDEACKRAKERSLTPAYKGCAVHVNAHIMVRDGEPKIMSYTLSDWFGAETVATYVNGQKRD